MDQEEEVAEVLIVEFAEAADGAEASIEEEPPTTAAAEFVLTRTIAIKNVTLNANGSERDITKRERTSEGEKK